MTSPDKSDAAATAIPDAAIDVAVRVLRQATDAFRVEAGRYRREAATLDRADRGRLSRIAMATGLDRACGIVADLAQSLVEHPGSSEDTRTARSECPAETWSWEHFRDTQVDGYWIRCTLTTPHGEHEDEHTGLRWRSRADEPKRATEQRASCTCPPGTDPAAYAPDCHACEAYVRRLRAAELATRTSATKPTGFITLVNVHDRPRPTDAP